MRAFVTGGTGFIGRHLVELLVASDYQVTCTVRQTSNLRWLKPLLAGKHPPIQLVTADLSNPDSPIPSLRGIDLVFHLAGLTKAFNADEYNRANAEATRRLIKACVEENGGMRSKPGWETVNRRHPTAAADGLRKKQTQRGVNRS